MTELEKTKAKVKRLFSGEKRIFLTIAEIYGKINNNGNNRGVTAKAVDALLLNGTICEVGFSGEGFILYGLEE